MPSLVLGVKGFGRLVGLDDEGFKPDDAFSFINDMLAPLLFVGTAGLLAGDFSAGPSSSSESTISSADLKAFAVELDVTVALWLFLAGFVADVFKFGMACRLIRNTVGLSQTKPGRCWTLGFANMGFGRVGRRFYLFA